MLILINKLVPRPVLSLRTGGVVAYAGDIIINPNYLKVEGIYCTDRFNKSVKILLTQDIREIITKGLIVDDYEVLTDTDDLIRLEEIMKLDFELIGKPVITDKKRRLGKVADFSLDNTSFYVQKLYIAQSLIRQLGGSLSVDRSEVIEVTDKKIIIKDPQKPLRERMKATLLNTNSAPEAPRVQA